MSDRYYVSDAHCLGIGRVSVAWARVDSLLMFLIGSQLGTGVDLTLVTFWHMGYNDRRDRLTAVVQLTQTLDRETQKEFDALITRMNDAYKIRNIVSHSVWRKGPGPNTIIPHVMKARGGQIKASGFNMPQELFAPERLYVEADKIQRLGQDLHDFAVRHLGYQDEPDEVSPGSAT